MVNISKWQVILVLAVLVGYVDLTCLRVHSQIVDSDLLWICFQKAGHLPAKSVNVDFSMAGVA